MSEHGPARLAVVGTGFIGRRHIEFLRSNALFDPVAAADPSPEAAHYLAERGIAHYQDFERMLDEVRPEGVVVATPNHLHEVVAVAALERGIPALVEKPIAHTLDSARRIVDASEKTGVAVLVGHHRRHNPLMRTARDFIRSGGIGKVISVAAQHLRRKPDAYYEVAWKREPGGGPVLINAIHDIDCLRFLVGEIDSLVAMTGNAARGFAVEDAVSVTFRFDGGALGTLTLSDAVQAPWAWELTTGEEPEYQRQFADCYLICGTEGALAVPTLTHWRNENGGGRADPFICKRLFYVPSDPWVEELKHFVDVIRGRAPSLVTAEDGLSTLASTLALLRSAEEGATIKISEMT